MADRLCGLARTAALCQLGRSIYETWLTINGRDDDIVAWNDLDKNSRRYFVCCAADLLEEIGGCSHADQIKPNVLSFPRMEKRDARTDEPGA